MADTLLIDLFKQLGSIAVQLAKQEINLLVGIDEEVQKLQGKLGMIKAMLDVAEERHAVKLRTEKLWLEQLQNQYYEMDDILDTWNTARIRAQIEKEEGKPADTYTPAVVKKKADDNHHNEFGPQINDEDVEEINNKDDVVDMDKNHEQVGADSAECVVDEQVEVDNDEG